MAYDFTTLPDRWDAGAFKYLEMQKKKPDVSRDAVPLSVADMEFLDPPQVVEGLKDYLDQELTAVTAEAAPSVNQVRNLLMHIAVRTTDCFREIYGGMNAFREPRDFDYAQLFTLRRFSDMRAWLFRLCDELFSRNESVLGRSASVVGFAIAYINQHYREGVTLKQVAAECHINTSYLGQVFHKETGSAFTDYVNALRIAEARRLLNNPTLKVYEVAEQVGFTDYHYFLKIFKKVTGITPSDLRS